VLSRFKKIGSFVRKLCKLGFELETKVKHHLVEALNIRLELQDGAVHFFMSLLHQSPLFGDIFMISTPWSIKNKVSLK